MHDYYFCHGCSLRKTCTISQHLASYVVEFFATAILNSPRRMKKIEVKDLVSHDSQKALNDSVAELADSQFDDFPV